MREKVGPEGRERSLESSVKPGGAVPPCARFLGVRQVEVHGRDVRVWITPTEAMCNPQGVVQGGIVAGMLDDVMGATLDHLEPGRAWATASLTTHFLNPVRPGEDLVGEARVMHEGRRVFFLEAWLRREDGTPVARASATCLWQGRSARTPSGMGAVERRQDET